MYKRKLGSSNLEILAIGLGCMGISWSYGPDSPKTLSRKPEPVNF